MKKTLLSILGVASLGAAVAQNPSPSWTLSQNASFTMTSAAARYLDAVDNNVVWLTGYDGTGPNRNYNWWAKSSNAGATFTSGNVFADTNTYHIGNLEGINANTAWVSAFLKTSSDRGGVFKTTNGGGTWTNMAAANMYSVAGTSFVNFVTFFTPSVGLTQGDPVGGEFEMYRTSDAGATWTAVPAANIPNPLPGEFGTINVYCRQGANDVWFGTTKNRIYHSADAGLTWSVSAALTSTLGGALAIGDMAFVSPNLGLCSAYFGPTGNGTLTLWNTTDGGATWNQIPSIDPTMGLNDFCAIPGTSWYASCGNGQGNQLLSFSQDNGVTWSNWNSTQIGYVAIDFANSATGWVSTFSGPTPTDGGLFKYTGNDLYVPTNASASFANPGANLCASVAITMTNNSTGAPIPTYTWSTNPAANISNTAAINPSITFTAAGVYTITLAAQNGTAAASVQSKTVNVSICTSIEEIAGALNSMNIYPNPASSQVNVEIPGVINYKYTLINLLGKTVASGMSDAYNSTIDVSTLAKGVYFLSVSNQGFTATKKIIIE